MFAFIYIQSKEIIELPWVLTVACMYVYNVCVSAVLNLFH